MYLTGLSVKGYKSLRETQLSDIPRIGAFIGPNNSGKSAILEAIAYLNVYDNSNSGLFQLLTRGTAAADWFQDVSTDHSGDAFQFTIELALSDKEKAELAKMIPGLSFGNQGFSDRLAASFRGGGEPPGLVVDEVRWSFRGVEFPYIKNHRVTELQAIAAIQDQDSFSVTDETVSTGAYVGLSDNALRTVDSELPDLAPFREMVSWIQRLCWLGPERAFATAVSLQTAVSDRPDELPRALQHLYNNDRPKFDRVERILNEIAPGTGSLGTPINQENVMTSIRLSSSRTDTALIHSGHGLSSILSTVLKLLEAPLGATVLLEEPETGLHAGAQRALANVLQDIAESFDLQILLTTHSPVFARDTEPFGTICVNQKQGGTVAIRVRRNEMTLLKHELGAQNSDLFMANMILFCEDDTTRNFLPPVFSSLGLDLQTKGIHVVPLHGVGKGRIARLREYLEYLAGSDVRRFVVLDDDEGVRTSLKKLFRDGILHEDVVHIWSRGKKPAELEDNFTSNQLILAANFIAENAGAAPRLTPEELATRTVGGGNMVSKVLQAYYYEEYGYHLSKARLGAKLAELFVSGALSPIPAPFKKLANSIQLELARSPEQAGEH